MKKHIMSITYSPKIDALKLGDCCQTIRKGRKVSVGDEIDFVGYDGKAWRKRVIITECYNIHILEYGIKMGGYVIPWHTDYVCGLAEYDFIDPPIGEALRDVLFGFYGTPDTPQEFQIIRWKVI